jgi:hypothetical protein
MQKLQRLLSRKSIVVTDTSTDTININITGPVNCGKSAFIKECSVWANHGKLSSVELFGPLQPMPFIWREIGRIFQEHVAYIDWDIVKGRQIKGQVVRLKDGQVADVEPAADFFRSNRIFTLTEEEFLSSAFVNVETLISFPFFNDTMDQYENKGITFEPFGLYCIENWSRITDPAYSPSVEDLIRVKSRTPCQEKLSLPEEDFLPNVILSETTKPHDSPCCLFINAAGFNQRKNSRKNHFEECFDYLEQILLLRGISNDPDEVVTAFLQNRSPIFIVFTELDRLQAKLSSSKHCKDHFDIFDHLPIESECPEAVSACLPVYEEYFLTRIRNEEVRKKIVFLATEVLNSHQCLLRILGYLDPRFNQRLSFLLGMSRTAGISSPIRVLWDRPHFDSELLHQIFSFVDWRSLNNQPPIY